MPFPSDERDRLLSVKGIGPTVIARLEQLGVDRLSTLAAQDAAALCAAAASMLGSRCWKNSPQARKAIEAAIALARTPA